MTKQEINDLTFDVLGAAIEVHKQIGSGLLESVYQTCLKRELEIRNIHFTSETKVPVSYKGINMETELRCDFYIENIIVVELKAVSEIVPVHEAQLLTYMKLLKAPKGILINFHSSNIFKEGQKTFVNEFFRNLPQF